MKKRKFNLTIGPKLLIASVGLLIGAAMVYLGFPEGILLATAVPAFTEDQAKSLTDLFSKAGDQNKEVIKEEIQALAKGFMTATVFEEKMNAIGVSEKVIKELTTAVEKQGEALRAMSQNNGNEEEKSIDQIIKEKAEDIRQIGKVQGKQVNFSLPVQKIVTRAGLTNGTLGMFLPGIGTIPYKASVLRPLFQSGTVSANSNGIIRYIDQNTITRSAAFVAEGATKPQSEITWIQRSLQIEKIADSVVVTKEAWEDIDFIQSELRRLLDVNLRLVEDAALYNGSGVTPIITGIYTYAPTFDAAAYAANAAMPKFEDGNLYDLIAVLRAVIMLDKGGKYDPKIVLMNPMDILRYKLLKDAEGRYLLPPFINADGTVIDGVRVVESSQVVANTLVIGDFDYAWLYDMGGTEVSMGWVNDQFIKNTFTILAERRLALLVRNSDLDGFRKVTSISAALTAITVVP
jgi:HK97 family phage major capsid protein